MFEGNRCPFGRRFILEDGSSAVLFGDSSRPSNSMANFEPAKPFSESPRSPHPIEQPLPQVSSSIETESGETGSGEAKSVTITTLEPSSSQRSKSDKGKYDTLTHTPSLPNAPSKGVSIAYTHSEHQPPTAPKAYTILQGRPCTHVFKNRLPKALRNALEAELTPPLDMMELQHLLPPKVKLQSIVDIEGIKFAKAKCAVANALPCLPELSQLRFIEYDATEHNGDRRTSMRFLVLDELPRLSESLATGLLTPATDAVQFSWNNLRAVATAARGEITQSDATLREYRLARFEWEIMWRCIYMVKFLARLLSMNRSDGTLGYYCSMLGSEIDLDLFIVEKGIFNLKPPFDWNHSLLAQMYGLGAYELAWVKRSRDKCEMSEQLNTLSRYHSLQTWLGKNACKDLVEQFRFVFHAIRDSKKKFPFQSRGSRAADCRREFKIAKVMTDRVEQELENRAKRCGPVLKRAFQRCTGDWTELSCERQLDLLGYSQRGNHPEFQNLVQQYMPLHISKWHVFPYSVPPAASRARGVQRPLQNNALTPAQHVNNSMHAGVIQNNYQGAFVSSQPICPAGFYCFQVGHMQNPEGMALVAPQPTCPPEGYTQASLTQNAYKGNYIAPQPTLPAGDYNGHLSLVHTVYNGALTASQQSYCAGHYPSQAVRIQDNYNYNRCLVDYAGGYVIQYDPA
ncbi:uncharacterized protein BCR38DRAFT_405778 [Pseudomassariella vexata]|uniref:Uncharacterized protein n=1 Tax=Pseudomassariella vexata TaxID=1141098 RepID=A0A1Y2EFV1_9PEZI|nr:uncharacterized protein BCR38DRAFT_405778 [Pseudomassariella vexata]ORY70136.1 hypothetical protein BCR38DRAFT_405778 [Pseudomassariella vexata]